LEGKAYSVHVRMGSAGFGGYNLTFPCHSSDDGRLMIFILAQLGCIRLLIPVIMLLNSDSVISLYLRDHTKRSAVVARSEFQPTKI